MHLTLFETDYYGQYSEKRFAAMRNCPSCSDIDNRKEEMLQFWKIPFFEPIFDVLYVQNIKQVSTTFSAYLQDDITKGEVIYWVLPTNTSENGSADVKYILVGVNHLGKMPNLCFANVDKCTIVIGANKLEELHFHKDFLSKRANKKVLDLEAINKVNSKLCNTMENADSQNNVLDSTYALLITTKRKFFSAPECNEINEQAITKVIFNERYLYN